MLACSVPLNGAAVLFAIGAMKLVEVPSAWTSLKVAESWNPLGHPTLVDQVGVLLVGALAGFSLTAPGWVPMAVGTAWAAWVAYPPSSAPHLAHRHERVRRSARPYSSGHTPAGQVP
jgi:hypothetical protein